MKKHFLILGLIMVLALTFVSCDDSTNSNNVLSAKQETLMQEAVRQVGMPNIVNFTQRKQLKMIQELCDQENLICYAYIVPELTGKPVFLGKCIGFGVPYATEYTNPQKIERWNGSGGYAILPQADPNGLFMPAAAEGTWVMLIDPATSEPHPVYCEPRLLVSPFPLSSTDGLTITIKK
jgi:hypothetical protein